MLVTIRKLDFPMPRQEPLRTWKEHFAKNYTALALLGKAKLYSNYLNICCTVELTMGAPIVLLRAVPPSSLAEALSG
jgi:hypothetical protein